MRLEELEKRLRERGWMLRKLISYDDGDRILAVKSGEEMRLTVDVRFGRSIDKLRWEEIEWLFP